MSDATFALFGREFQLTGGAYRPEFHDVLTDDDHTVALLHVTATRDGRRLDLHYALVLHIDDGRITEDWVGTTDPAAYDEFWAQRFGRPRRQRRHTGWGARAAVARSPSLRDDRGQVRGRVACRSNLPPAGPLSAAVLLQVPPRKRPSRWSELMKMNPLP